MKIINILMVLLSFQAFSQDSSANKQAPKYIIHKAELYAGDLLAFGDKEFRFLRVVADSRCPKGVTCIWAGEVQVELEMFKNGKSQGSIVINQASNSLEDFFSLSNVKLSGLVVEPYPSIHKKILPEDYKVFLSLSEKVETN